MSNQLKRARRAKLKSKQNNINRNESKLTIDNVPTFQASLQAIEIFQKIPDNIDSIPEICRLIGSHFKGIILNTSSDESDESDETMQVVTLTALYLLTKSSDFKSEISESDFRTTLKAIRKIDSITLAAKEGIAISRAKK